MRNENPPRTPPAVQEQRALDRWEGEGGAVAVDPTPRPVAGRRKASPQQKRPPRKDAPAGDQ